MKSQTFIFIGILLIFRCTCWMRGTEDTENIENFSHFAILENNVTLLDPFLNLSSLYDLFRYSKEKLEQKPTVTRLPRRLFPYHYNLTLKPIITSKAPFRFWGRVHIHFECIQSTNLLIINGKYPPIWPSVNISSHPDNEKHLPAPVLDTYIFNKSSDLLIFSVKNGFAKGGKYIFKADFSKRMSYNGKGLYWASYVNDDNYTEYLASTYFQPMDARKAFPCFDEVDMKATFNISVIRHADHLALSNMPKIKTMHLVDDWMEDFFDTTPKMSTYLVCIAVGKFKRHPASSTSETNVNISLYAIESQLNSLNYVAHRINKLVDWFYGKVFHPFVEQKIDHIAIPSRSVAMENWGLITYSEDILSVSNETTSVIGKVKTLIIVSHEIAHMRFGNLVTCKWWSELWIHEGIATYFNFLPLEALGIDGSQLQQTRMFDGLHRIMAIDQKNSSSQISKTVVNPSEAFNIIVYYKTAAILRHLQGIVSRPVLFRALERFLRNNAFGSVETQNFTDALDEQARMDGVTRPDGGPLDFKVILIPWLEQVGFPLVSIKRVNNSFIQASQSHYFNPRNQTARSAANFNNSWEIPITLVGKGSSFEDWKSVPTNWIHVNETSTLLNISEFENDWYILNPHQQFYYRTLYDEDNRRNLTKQLLDDHKVIPTETRAQLIDDVFDLARNLYLSLSEALEFLRYLRYEDDYNPWEVAMHHVTDVASFFEDEPFFEYFQMYMADLLEQLLDKLGYEFPENEAVFRSLLRGLAISSACNFGSERCLDHVHSLYKLYIADPKINSVDPNVLQTVLCWGIRDGTYEDWMVIYAQHRIRKNSPVKNERNAYMQALICTTNTTLLDVIYDDILKGHTKHSVIVSSKYLADKVWEFIKTSGLSNAKKLKSFESIIERWYSEDQWKQLKEFESNRSNVEQLVMQSILQVEANMEFYKNNVQHLRKWLEEEVSRNAVERSPARSV